MQYNVEVFNHQYSVVVAFVQRLAYYRGLTAVWNGQTTPSEFWAATVDDYLKLATVAWCNVFGSRKEALHWTQTPTCDILQQASQDFHHRLLSKTGFTQQQWETYHKEMRAFRDKYVAHFDLANRFTDPVPYFDPALQVAYAYQEWSRELIKPVLLNQPTLSSLYEQCKAKASTIIIQQPRP